MGKCVSRPTAVHTTTAAAMRNSIKIVDAPQSGRTSPRTFTVVNEDEEECLHTLVFTIQHTWQHHEVEILHVKETDGLLMRVGHSYFPVTVAKCNTKNRYQASVSIK